MLNKGIRIGRLFGIDIRIDWSWFFIFFLVTWNLSSLISAQHSEWPASMVWGLAIIASLLFFASVLAHEMAHSLVARARGTPVQSITLFLFGGVAGMEREPASPKSEFLIAIMGPVTSLVIGFILLIAGGVLGGVSGEVQDTARSIARMGPGTLILLWLGSINVILGIFNLVPGFPLDGGRVLRSILWALTGDLRKATRWASQVGQVIAWTMILSGIAMLFGAELPFFGKGLLGGMWLIFIGFFLKTAASNSYRHVIMRDALEGVPLSRLLRDDPVTVAPQLDLQEFVQDYVLGHDESSFPVVENGYWLGTLATQDLRVLPRQEWAVKRVEDVMTPASELPHAETDDDLASALRKMLAQRVDQLPVIQDGRFVGILRRRDIIRWLQLDGDSEAR